MSKYSKKNNISEKTKEEALKIARGTQRPGQTKEQTKLIAQGIQKGIELYKKTQKEKSRELDKKLNKARSSKPITESSAEVPLKTVTVKQNKLPWFLLIASWIAFSVYLYVINFKG